MNRGSDGKLRDERVSFQKRFAYSRSLNGLDAQGTTKELNEMIVSWDWLRDYVSLDGLTPDVVASRLMMAGLNLESVEPKGADTAIDLEITSNRPDCLGHIGVAREISVLFGRPLKIHDPELPGVDSKQAPSVSVEIAAKTLCPRYTARVIRGVKVGPSPSWLAKRLEAIGVATVNNVVDVTNYVMLECGQPLHAFDFSELAGGKIVVREASQDEEFLAINHQVYKLDRGMCVIADAKRAVALGGVMGGADSEVSDRTKDLLIEAAEFAPLSIRAAARKLRLHSPSSYRFERGLDSETVDWASRRCCELILKVAGGSVEPIVVDVGTRRPALKPVSFRASSVKRSLGIEVPWEESTRILEALGCAVSKADGYANVTAPSWRRELEREIDLVEEVARIHGYDKIPDDVAVPMTSSRRRIEDRVLEKVRHAMQASGFDEALTPSMVSGEWNAASTQWTNRDSLETLMPMLKGASRPRMSLIPSLLECRRVNETLSNDDIELFETARIYLPGEEGQMPIERFILTAVSERDFLEMKGVLEALLDVLQIGTPLQVSPIKSPLLDSARSARLSLDDSLLGFLGAVSDGARKMFRLRSSVTLLEIDLGELIPRAKLVTQMAALSEFPSMSRDLNLIVREEVRWAALEQTVRAAAGDSLENVRFESIYRDPAKDGAGTKRVLFSLRLRSSERTLTGEEADAACQKVVAACGKEHAAVLLGSII